MNISERYRELVRDARTLRQVFNGSDDAQELKLIGKATAELTELEEQVGDIPRIQLESKLTPVLLKAHSLLDRSRLLLQEKGAEDRAAEVWELEQKVYRLLNAL
ncbi:MAG: hypothetical protein R2940_09280 [Syntrophotaleaceae bacterium]